MEKTKEVLSLNTLRPAPGATKKPKRVGRGTAAGKGRTCGKGHKGQLSRSGYTYRPAFEGGQMPIQRRLPKRGFSNYPFRKIYQVINLRRLGEVFSGEEKITPMLLLDRGLIKKKDQPVKILGDGEINTALNIEVHAVSKSAMEKIKTAGGEVHLIC